MSKLNLKKNEVQLRALEAWVNDDKRATCEIITGLGKTFLAFHALYSMPKNNDVHLFLAETISRKEDILADAIKYKEIFDRDVFKDYNLEFYCYQTVYKWKKKSFGLVIADEIHDSLTPAYFQFYTNNTYKALLGLSATIIRATSYEINGKMVTKGTLLDAVAPICFSYGIKEGQVDETSRKLKIYVIQHKLEDKEKTVVAGSQKKRFMQTEAAAYEYWDKQHKRSWYIEDANTRNLQISLTSTKRSRILYNLESKTSVVKKLLQNISGKSIVFGNSIDSLLKVTPNVVSSKNTEDKNKNIRDRFDTGLIQVIGSFKKLKQGANLKGLDNCILMSYYSTDKDFIQRIGRLRQNGEIGNVFILLTQGTQEEVWFSKMMESISENLDITYCPDVDFYLKKIKN